MLPFTADAFFDVFARYNTAIWPTQIIAYLLGFAAISMVLAGIPARNRVASGTLAAMWLWTGIAYHMLFFAPINAAAQAFGIFFIVQGLLFATSGVMPQRLRYSFDGSPAAWAGIAFISYAAILYPAIGWLTGHTWPDVPVFGMTPCPVTIFTLGMLLIAEPPVPRRLLVIPFLWSLIGGSAAFLLGVAQDWPLLFSGLIAVALIEFRRRNIAAA